MGRRKCGHDLAGEDVKQGGLEKSKACPYWGAGHHGENAAARWGSILLGGRSISHGREARQLSPGFQAYKPSGTLSLDLILMRLYQYSLMAVLLKL